MAKANVSRTSYLLMLEAFAVVSIFVLCLYGFIQPRWETNDDIAMSMAVHGYGIAAAPTPNILFSNVIWGYISGNFPSIFGVTGYSGASLLALICAATLVYFGIVQRGCGRPIGCAACFLLFTRPFIFPQFTLNAGLLFVGAFVALTLYFSEKNPVFLWMAGVVATLSFLVRSQEFLLATMIALPLLPWRRVLEDRASQAAFVGLAVILAFASVFDAVSYRAEGWAFYSALNPLRAVFTDFNTAEIVKSNSVILAKHHYSVNDIALLQGWFFVDKAIADPVSLKSVLSDIGMVQLRSAASEDAISGFLSLFGIRLMPVLVATALISVMLVAWRSLIAFLLILISCTMISALGRLDTLRIYEPLFALVLVATLVVCPRIAFLKSAIILVILALGTLNFVEVVSTSMQQQQEAEVAYRVAASLPLDPVVIWGAGLPFEFVYPVLDRANFKTPVALYPLGAFTWAPFSVAFAQQNSGDGMIERLRRDTGVWIVASEINFRNLAVYCREHLGMQLEEVESRKSGETVLSRRRCTKSIDQ